jgi:hypothetical protein
VIAGGSGIVNSNIVTVKAAVLFNWSIVIIYYFY